MSSTPISTPITKKAKTPNTGFIFFKIFKHKIDVPVLLKSKTSGNANKDSKTPSKLNIKFTPPEVDYVAEPLSDLKE
jgi:hypothetical protein